MMYGEELHVLNSAVGDAALPAAIALEETVNTIVYARTLEVPGMVVYWGYRCYVTFSYATLTAQGILGLRRKSRVIKTAVLGNAGGTLYAVGDRMSVTQTGASGGILEVTAAPGGIVTTVKIITPGVNYTAASNLATVALNGTGTAFTVTISDIIEMGTMNLLDGAIAGKLYMKRVSNAITDDVSPTSKPPASYNAGEKIEIYIQTAGTGGQNIAGDFKPMIICQNRGENLAAQGLWVEAA